MGQAARATHSLCQPGGLLAGQHAQQQVLRRRQRHRADCRATGGALLLSCGALAVGERLLVQVLQQAQHGAALLHGLGGQHSQHNWCHRT
jgi:hypothetical protein